MSFTLADLNQKLFDRVVFLEQSHSSGLGGPGAVIMITEDGEEYMLGMEGFEYSEWDLDKFIPLLSKGDQKDSIDYHTCFLVEEQGWKYFHNYGNVLIHSNYYERISEAYEKCKEKSDYPSWLDAARRVLNPEDKIPRNVYEGTEAVWKKQAQEREAAEQRQALVRLTEDDLVWKDLYINNQKFNGTWLEGTYLLLFKKNKDSSISGSKWTIEFQREEFKPCSHKANAPIDAYNLYYKSYENMVGMLQYKEPNKDGDSCYEYSNLQDGVNSYGKFVRSYKTLGAAKQGALYRNECAGWGNYNKDNLLRIDWSNIDMADMQKDYREKILKKETNEKKLQLLFAEKYVDIYTALAEHDGPGNAIQDITEKLHITREEVIKMWEFKPTMFCKSELDKARRMVEKMEFTETPVTAATKFISAAERMDSIYKLLWLAKPENDPEFEIRMENLIKASIDYSYYRSRWLGISPIEQNNTEHDRTISHNILIEAKDALSGYMLDHGMNISWAIKLGDERKMIGDFGCYLSYVQAIKAR